ncbi:MAG: hypothetical protein ACTHOU_12135, partial [Aureliella sp.]
MRIGVLEWTSSNACGSSAQFDASVRQEGWAMCRAALLSLAAGGHCAVAVVRPELADDPQLRSLAGDALQ